jgi:hypothetical protein
LVERTRPPQHHGGDLAIAIAHMGLEPGRNARNGRLSWRLRRRQNRRDMPWQILRGRPKEELSPSRKLAPTNAAAGRPQKIWPARQKPNADAPD